MLNSPATPDRIGPYAVVRPIARGGMAEVYEVTDPVSGEHLALKLLMEAGAAVPRFHREYEAMTRLNHPAIVRVYHYGTFEGKPWLTMELLDGVVLQSRVKTLGNAGTVERTEEVLRVGWHLADALEYIHVRGLVHRDLKSANVIVLPDGRVKLFDFGTAFVRDPVEQITQPGEFVGTFAYASPEQLTGSFVDHRSDLYSFGAVLYRLLTGKAVFEAKEPHELARLHVKQAPRPMRELVPELPVELDELVMRMLAKSPADRPQRASEIADAFERVVGRSLAALPGSGLAVHTERPVGREEEARAVRSALREAKPGRAILVVGGSGAEPDRFVNAVAESARVDGWRVFPVALREGRSLRTFVDALRSMGRGAGAKAASDDLKAIAKADALGLPHRRAEVVAACEACLAAVAEVAVAPVLVVLPGLHRAGPVELEVLASLRRTCEERGFVINFLASSDPSVNDPASLVRRRWSDALRVPLKPLTPAAVALAVGSLLHRRPPPAELARRIHAASGGQPGFVEEIVRELVAAGGLAVDAHDGNRLRWSGDQLEVPLAPSAASALEVALREVPHAHLRILEALSLVGGAVDLAPLARAVGWPSAALRSPIEALEHSGWVRVDDDSGAVSLARALAVEVLRARMAPTRRVVVQRALARSMEGESSPARVRLLLVTGAVQAAVEEGYACARRLADEGQVARALEVLDQVAPVSANSGAPPALLARLHLLHTSCMLLVRPTDMATARSLVRATELATDPEGRARTDYTRARLQWVIGHYPNFRKFMHRAWDQLPPEGPPELAAKISAQLVVGYVWAGQARSSREWAGRASDVALGVSDVRVRAEVDVALAAWHFSRGQLVEAERLADNALASLVGARPGAAVWDALVVRTRVLRVQGRYSEAFAMLAPRLPEARAGQAATNHVRLLLVLAACEADLYRLGRAQEAIDELDATLHKGEHLHLRIEADLVRGRVAMASGRLHEAEQVLGDAVRRAQQAQLVVLGELARAALGEALWALGREDDARDAFQGAVLGLIGTADVPALVEVCAGRARALAEFVSPDELFRPVADPIGREPFWVARMEQALAEGRFQRAEGDPARAQLAYVHAATHLAHIGAGLDDTDRAALRVHPWAQVLRVEKR